METLERDAQRRPVIYLAEWKDAIGASSTCVFASVDPAIYFVVTGLGDCIDWKKFPDPAKRYPYEDRVGSERLDPIFRVERTVGARVVSGQVTRMGVADVWIVGNGIAEASRGWFRDATYRDQVELSGVDDKLQGRV